MNRRSVHVILLLLMAVSSALGKPLWPMNPGYADSTVLAAAWSLNAIARTGIDTVWFGGADSSGYAFENGIWDFSDGSRQGWSSIDLTWDQVGRFGRVTAPSFQGDMCAPLFPASTGQIWCGLHEDEALSREFFAGMGYGNNWCQSAFSPSLTIVPASQSLDIAFKYFSDCETDFDYTYVRICCYDDQGNRLADHPLAAFTGVLGSPASPSLFDQGVEIPAGTLPANAVRVRLELCFQSDRTYSDQDGYYDTECGPFAADDIQIAIGSMQYTYDFEGDMQGWTFACCPQVGCYLGVVGDAEYQGWLADAAVTDCTFGDSAMEFVDETGSPHSPPGHPGGHYELALSPVVPRTDYDPEVEHRVLLQLDAFQTASDQTGTSFRLGIRYYPYYSSIPDPPPSWSPFIGESSFPTNADSYCHGVSHYFEDPLLPPDWDSLQVCVEIISDCSELNIPPGGCTQEGDTGGAPLFDNLRVGLVRLPVSAPCCDSWTGTCAMRSEAQCGSSRYEWHPELTDCSPSPCTAEPRACCFGAECSVLTRSECQSAGGYWYWYGGYTTCSPSPCEAACCISTACQLLNEENCLTAGGAYLPGVAECSPSPCPTPCCANGDCAMISVIDCLSAGGEVHAEVSSCDPSPCGPWVLHVHPDGTGEYPTIQAAVDAARTGDIVELADGWYGESGNRDVQIDAKLITVRSGGGDPATCTIDCDGAGRGFSIFGAMGPGEMRLEGITITHGNALTDVGGAIQSAIDAPLVVSHCRIIQNWSGVDGGGVYCGGTWVNFDDCLFEGNWASQASAIWYSTSPFGEDDTLMVSGCTFHANSAGEGGTILASGGNVIISGCTFVENSCPEGSSLLHSAESAVIQNSILAFGIGGAAVTCYGAPPSLVCSDIYGNAGGDWTGCIADQLGVNGNISLDPLLCGTGSPEGEPYTLDFASPCAAGNHPPCGQMGAWPVGCGIGACCLENDCAVLPPEQCAQLGGRYNAAWLSCDPNRCPSWVEVCFDADTREGWPPLEVAFDEFSRNNPLTWSWDFESDGVIDASSPDVEHTYTVPGLYDVTLMVTNETTADTLTKRNLIRVYAEDNVFIQPAELVAATPGRVPVSWIGTTPLGAVSLYFAYDDAKLTYQGIESYVPGETFYGGVVGDWISVQWFDETGGIDPIVPGVDPDTLFAILVTNDVSFDSTNVEFYEPLCMLADRNGNSIDGVAWGDEDPYGVVSIRVGALVSGRVAYFWEDQSISDACLSLGPLIPGVCSDEAGLYEFQRCSPGDYALTITKTTDRGGINSLDAIKVIRHSTGQEPLGDPHKLIAANVNGDGVINALDAIKIVRAAVGFEPLPSGDWRFEPPSALFEPLDADTVVDFVGIRMGDVNGSWLPEGSRAAGRLEDVAARGNDGNGTRTITLALPDTMLAAGSATAHIPLLVTGFDGIGAVSLRIAFADSVLAYGGVTSQVPGVGFVANVVSSEVRIEWYDPTGGAQPISFGDGTLLTVAFTPAGQPSESSALDLTNGCALGDPEGDPIEGVQWIDGSCELIPDAGAPDHEPDVLECLFHPIPSPRSTKDIRFTYDLPRSSAVLLQVYDIAGRLVATLVDENESSGRHVAQWNEDGGFGPQIRCGVYLAKMKAGEHVSTRKFVLIQ